MAATAAVVNGTLPQANSGTVDLESAGFGTPSAALIFLNIANTTNNPQSSMQYCIGYWDGTTVQSTANFSTDAVGTTSTGRLSDINELRYGTSAGPLVYTVANATNGITITKTSGTTGVDRYVTAILFAGLTNAYVGYKSLGTGTSAVDITDPGFKPDAVFMSCIGSNSADTSTSHAIHSFGIAHNNSSDTVTQGYVSVSSEDSVTTSDSDSRTSHSDSATQTFNGTTSWEATASAFDASGFSLTPTASAGSDYVLYLAIELPNADDFHVDVIDAAISTGNDAKTGFGFQPIVAGVVSANNTALDSITGGYQFNFGASDGTNSATHWVHDEDAVGTTNVKSEYSSSEFLHLTDDAGVDDAIATLSSFDSDGLTLNYSDAAAGASKLLIWAIGDSSSSGTTINGALESLSLSTFAATVSRDSDISASLESLTLTENAATISSDRVVAAALESLSLTANAANVNAAHDIQAALESLSLSTFQASLGTDIAAQLESLTLSTFLATISTDRAIQGNLESLSLTTYQGSVSLGSVINAALESLQLSTLGATVKADTSISASLESLVLTELSAQVSIGSVINANLESLTLTANGSVITFDTGINATLESLTLSAFNPVLTLPTSALTAEGLQYTLNNNNLHYTLKDNRLHYSLPVNRLHFTFKGK